MAASSFPPPQDVHSAHLDIVPIQHVQGDDETVALLNGFPREIPGTSIVTESKQALKSLSQHLNLDSSILAASHSYHILTESLRLLCL